MDRPVISVINGPNLNLLGLREPEIYGRDTLADVESRCATTADALGFEVDCFQSNHEGAIVDEIHRMRTAAAGFVVNLGAYTHTSIAIRDALATVTGPFVEVHISNVHAREAFRAHSHVSALAQGVIVGCGVQGYDFAVARIADLVNHH